MLALFVFVSALCWYGAFRWRRRRLYELAARVPGLPDLPFIGNAHQFSGNTHDIMKSLQQISRCAMENDGLSKFWIGPTLLVVMTDPVDVEMILKTCLEKSDLHRFNRDILGNHSLFAPVSIWRRRRKIMSGAFSSRFLNQAVEVFANQSDILARRLMEHDGHGPFSAWSYLSSYSLDSICETTLGVELRTQKHENLLFVSSMNIILDILIKRIFRLWYQPNWLFKWFPDYQKLENAKKHFLNFFNVVINYKKDEIPKQNGNNDVIQFEHAVDTNFHKRNTILNSLTSLSGREKLFTKVELREELLMLIGAATDTSASGLGFMLMLLAKYPEIQNRIYHELNEVFGDTERPLVKEDLSKLVNTERLVKETLRLFPPAPFITRKIQEEITLPSGRILPANCEAVVSIWGAHRDPAHWGPDAGHFDPDRFLPERYRPRHACSFMPFSHGPRNCIGYRYGMMSLKTSFVNVLRRCRVMGEPERGPVPNIDVKLEFIMKPLNDFQLQISRKT